MYRRFWRLYTAENRILSFLTRSKRGFSTEKIREIGFLPATRGKILRKKNRENRITARSERQNHPRQAAFLRRPGFGSTSARLRKYVGPVFGSLKRRGKTSVIPGRLSAGVLHFRKRPRDALKRPYVTVNSSTASITFHGAGNPVRCSTDSPKVR